jgi:hypothetical protein
VVVDSAVQDIQELIQVLPEDVHVEILDPSERGIQTIGDILSRLSGVETLHIVSHGSGGQIYLGEETLSSETLDRYADTLQEWGKSLSKEADILVYGCRVSESETGEGFVSRLAHLTGADVAASRLGTINVTATAVRSVRTDRRLYARP